MGELGYVMLEALPRYWHFRRWRDCADQLLPVTLDFRGLLFPILGFGHLREPCLSDYLVAGGDVSVPVLEALNAG
jgi:hypothetical protein